MLYFWRNYGKLALAFAVSGAFLAFNSLLTLPLAFVTGARAAAIAQWELAVFVFLLTLLAIRLVKREIIQGVLARRAGQELPQLVNDLAGVFIFFTGVCVILSWVFQKDITAFVAAGGASLMVLGLALRDMVLAAFTGIVLNVEKPFKPGDMVRLADKFQGRIERITWRVTVLQTGSGELVFVPNLLLANAIIVNLDMPDKRSKRFLEVAIDYASSVDSVERILYAAALGAGVPLIGSPSVNARRMERDGVVYEISFTISNFADAKTAEHAMIKCILQRMRDAGINVTFPKREVIHSEARAPIANRSLDSFYLVQQCRLFRGLPSNVCQRVANELKEHHFVKGATIVRAGDQTNSMFVVGEGLARRAHTNRDGSSLVVDRFIPTESFGRRSLFCLDSHAATVTAETDVLIYELERDSFARMIEDIPGMVPMMSLALAQLSARPGGISEEADAAALQRQIDLYRGQIEAAYGARADEIAMTGRGALKALAAS